MKVFSDFEKEIIEELQSLAKVLFDIKKLMNSMKRLKI